MFYRIPFYIDTFRAMTQGVLETWPIDKLEKFLEQAIKAYNNEKKIKELYKKYLPKQFDFCEIVYLHHNEAIRKKNEENPKDEQLKLVSDKMILKMAGDFLDNIIIPTVQEILEK